VKTKPDSARAVQIFHALSDETRIEVLDMLKDGERCVCDLQDGLDAAQSRMSFHLKVLKDAGFLLDRKEGRWVYYSVNPDAFGEMAEMIGSLKPTRRALPTRRDAACCD
jgi:ArsR family transcriptional regulator